MRLRTILLVLSTIAIVLFALLNWTEFNRTSTLNLGWRTVTAALGMVMLGLLALGLIAMLLSSASAHTRHLKEAHQHHKDLHAQRELADRAEASRFVELRTRLDEHLRESRQREASAGGVLEQTIGKSQRELRTQIEQMNRSLSMRLGEMEARLEARLEPESPGAAKAFVRSADTPRGELIPETPRENTRENARTEATHEVVRQDFVEGQPQDPTRRASAQEHHAHLNEDEHDAPLRADPRDRLR